LTHPPFGGQDEYECGHPPGEHYALARLHGFHLHGERRLLVAVKSFNDGSGKSDSKAISLACAAALEPQWLEFDKDWGELLAEYGLRCFHMADAMALRNHFTAERGWSEPRVEEIVHRIFVILHKHQSMGMQFRCATVIREDYERARVEHPTLRPMASICVNFTVGGLAIPTGEQAILYFDRNEEFLHKVNRVWLKKRKRKKTNIGWVRQVTNIIPVDSAQYAIQAADVVAWTMNRKFTVGDYRELTFRTQFLCQLNCAEYDYNALIERYANDKWT